MGFWSFLGFLCYRIVVLVEFRGWGELVHCGMGVFGGFVVSRFSIGWTWKGWRTCGHEDWFV